MASAQTLHNSSNNIVYPQAPIDWEEVSVTPILVKGRSAIPDAAKKSIHKNKISLKGPLETPIGKGHQSLNLTLRKVCALSCTGLSVTY